ncbi:MAG: hypothetical protein V5A43_02350, partial [Haloarculaceae archaeon]
MSVTLEADRLAPYRRFSLYNSPYVAHVDGSAVDLYPPPEAHTIPSPVAGEVLDVHTVRAPPQPYAEHEDHLILVDTGTHVARLMHVEPEVEPGDVIGRGDALGRPVRAGFFAPWVPVHLHLEFRPYDVDPVRASGSIRLDIAVDVRALTWDGTGTVVESGETWARLDSPEHPDPGGGFAGVAAVGTGAGDAGRGDERRWTPGPVLDGGVPHYPGGGLLGRYDGDGESGDDDREVGEVGDDGSGRVTVGDDDRGDGDRGDGDRGDG